MDKLRFMDYLFVVGFVSILGQVVLLRELSVALYGVELIYTLALGIWLFCTACGAMISRKSAVPSFANINVLFFLLSFTIPLDIASIRSARLLASDIPGAYLPLNTQALIVLASLLPVGLLLGLLFQWTAKAYMAGGRTLAAAYGIESVGGLVGGVFATLFLRFGFQNFLIALFCALAAAGSCFLHADRKKGKWLIPAAVALISGLTLLVWKAAPVDRWMTSWIHPNLVETFDTPYSRITVTLQNGQASVFENDALLFDTESTRAEEFVTLAALQHPDPKRVLVLGGGVEGTVREALLHLPQRVDYVELNPALVDFVPRHLTPDIQKSLHAPNVRIILDDPRHFLIRAMSYDLILIGMPEPSSGQANRFYTQEFFRQCASRLNNRGVVAFSLQSAENLWTLQLTRKMVSIYRAAKSAFRDVIFLPGAHSVILGSMDPLEKDFSVLAARMAKRGLHTRLISADYLRYLYTNDRFHEIAGTLESGSAPINSDVRPICYQYAIMVWLSKFYPSSQLWEFSFPEMSGSRYVVLLMVLALPLLSLRMAPWPARRIILAGIAGYAGMVLETILLLYFQTRNGILFQDLGILLTAFMAGLASGALAVNRTTQNRLNALGLFLILGFSALSTLIGMDIHSRSDAGMMEIFVLLGLTGFFVAGIFGFACLRESGNQMNLVAPLYSADLVGGCLGSVLASLIFAPLAGLALTTWLIVPIVLFLAFLL